MSRLSYIITIGLLLPTLVLNFPFGPPNVCQTSAAKQQMDCCVSKVSARESSGLSFTSSSCLCQTSEHQQTDVPLAILCVSLKPLSKKIEKYSLNYSLRLILIFKPLSSSQHFDSGNKSTSYANFKIYDLVSSYLI